MAWLKFYLVQLVKFWTSIALNIAKWQLLKQGYCCPYQGQQLSYIVLDMFQVNVNKIHLQKE
jgi:hypothetical protein